jgi:Fic family protein
MINFNKLDNLKAKLDKYRPLTKEVVKNLQEDLILRWTYNSNAIEGNTLTLQETKVALEGITIGGKTLREHFETINHREAILFIEQLVKRGEKLSELDIKSIHSLILKNIDDKNSGAYRKTNVIISGAEHKPPHFIDLPQKMENFIKWYSESIEKLHPVEFAARVHIDFVGIHPFIDGNGRSSRLLMNLELMKSGFPPAIIKFEDRLEYYRALDLAHTRDEYQPFMELVEKVVIESFEPYFYVLGV